MVFRIHTWHEFPSPFDAAAVAAVGGDFRNLKERSMTPKFLREEASRFRGMAEEQTRDASKLRLLGMAADYEARATAADGLVVAAPPVEEVAVPEADVGEAVAAAPTLAAPAVRRGVGRPRLRLGA
jgi:hypothetical protein